MAFIILGSVLESVPAIVLFGPLLFPIARAEGVNQVHYAMVVILAMGIGLLASPFGVVTTRPVPSAGSTRIGACARLIAAVPWISTVFL